MRFDVPAEARTVLELLEEMRAGRLNLNPDFQRRSVWRPIMKSYLMDTVVRGLPIPLIILRHKLDVSKKRRTLEVADGQQRLRTLFSYIEPSVLDDFDAENDEFTIRKAHNEDVEIAGKPFDQLPDDVQSEILAYRVSVVFLPTAMEDRDVLDLFARLNSTGLRLTPQELRNANYFGEFKATMYRIARENLERWQRWKLYSPQEIARMKDVELVSDLANMILYGLRPKTVKEIDDLYAEFDEDFPDSEQVERRLDYLLGEADRRAALIADSIYSREMHFVTLLAALYDKAWGLDSSLTRRRPRAVGHDFWDAAERVSESYRSGRIPKRVAEASQGAATDLKRRQARLDYLLARVDGDGSSTTR